MKLLYLAPIRFPSERAHGAQIAHMCTAFAKHGVDVTLLVPKRANAIVEDAFSYYNIPKCFRIRSLFCTPWNVGSKFGYYSNLFVYLIRILSLTLLHKADVIFSRNEHVIYAASFFVPVEKLVWESHVAKYSRLVQSLFAKGIRCVVISEGIRDFYLEQGLSSEQLLVAHDGIDESFFGILETKDAAQKRLGIQTDMPVVMYIGGLDKYKGVEILLEAAQQENTFQLVMIGGTDELISSFVKRYSNVQFLGRRPYKELANNQQAADILVCTNSKDNPVSAKYTSPLKLFSYLTSQVPTIAADVPSITNVVSNTAVYLYDPSDKDAIVTIIKKILNDSEEARSRAKTAHEISKRYTWAKRAEVILGTFTSYECK